MTNENKPANGGSKPVTQTEYALLRNDMRTMSENIERLFTRTRTMDERNRERDLQFKEMSTKYEEYGEDIRELKTLQATSTTVLHEVSTKLDTLFKAVAWSGRFGRLVVYVVGLGAAAYIWLVERV